VVLWVSAFWWGLVGLGCVGSVRRVYGYEDYNVLTYGILFSCTFALAAVSGWCSVVISAQASVCAVEEDLACACWLRFDWV